MINVHFRTVGVQIPDWAESPAIARTQMSYVPSVGDPVAYDAHSLRVITVVHYPWGDESTGEMVPFVSVVVGP